MTICCISNNIYGRNLQPQFKSELFHVHVYFTSIFMELPTERALREKNIKEDEQTQLMAVCEQNVHKPVTLNKLQRANPYTTALMWL